MKEEKPDFEMYGDWKSTCVHVGPEQKRWNSTLSQHCPSGTKEKKNPAVRADQRAVGAAEQSTAAGLAAWKGTRLE